MSKKRILTSLLQNFSVNGKFFIESCHQKWQQPKFREKQDGFQDNVIESYIFMDNGGCESTNIKINNARKQIINYNYGTENSIKKETIELDSLIILGCLFNGSARFERFFQGEGKFECPHCGKKLRHAEIIQEDTGNKTAYGDPVFADFCVSNNEWFV